MLSQGLVELETPELSLTLVRSSETVAALKPKAVNGFDFTPGDLLVERSTDGYYHLGDIDLRLRRGDSGDWTSYSTALARAPVIALATSSETLAAADLAPTLPSSIPLQITRSWVLEQGKLALRFVLKNRSTEPVQIGALGIPMIFNNVLNHRSLEQAHANCSFYDPYIGEDAGYLQVTRLSGQGPALLVVPDGRTPFEAYKPILNNHPPDPPRVIFEDPTARGITFEGFYDWMVHSQAFAENEWKNAQPWNPPSAATLNPGESRTYGVKFLVSDSIRDIERTLAANHRPVAVGVPGYVLPADIHARLFLKYPRRARSVLVEPEGALDLSEESAAIPGWQSYRVEGKTWGRSRLTVTYQDGLVQTIQYFVTKPERQAVKDMGRFLTTRQWFVGPDEPFHRSPSVMTYDRELNRIVTEDSRVWIAGLSDEGGAGSWLAAAMKELVEPDKDEIDRYQHFVDGVLWGGIQFNDGAKQNGVRKSLFYYQPDQLPANYYRTDLNWTTWTSWNKQASEAVDRSYNYPHVAAAYWVLYQLARNHQELVTNHGWEWYLSRAYETSMAMTHFAPELARFGQMEGDVFLAILEDLKREGMTDRANQLEAKMRERADHWRAQAYPFGSEMPWDSTGQEEVYAWSKYFGYQDKAKVTLNAILGYDPAVPHWGYNGSARRYWDFIFGASAKYSRIERQLHHYGSGINAIPLLAEYREHPDDFYLLRVGYGGTMGVLSDIDQDGFLSPAFHSFPDMLRFDPVSGDNGPNFFGYAWNTATYVVDHPEFGWIAFGGNIQSEGSTVRVTPLDSARTRIYISSLGLWLTLDAGEFDRLDLNSTTGVVRVGFAAATHFTQVARLRVEQPVKLNRTGSYHPTESLKRERDAYLIPLTKETMWIDLNAAPQPAPQPALGRSMGGSGGSF
jgi:hypothetical protein